MNLAVVGSRTIENYSWVKDELDKAYGFLHPTKIISGGAMGVDSLAEKWAKERGIPIQIEVPKARNRREAFYERNRKIVDSCDGLIAFWDGESGGTRYTFNYALKQRKPIVIFQTKV